MLQGIERTIKDWAPSGAPSFASRSGAVGTILIHMDLPRTLSTKPRQGTDPGHWVDHLNRLADMIVHPSTPHAKETALSSLWLLLNAKLRRLMLAHCRTHGWIQPEDLEDLVSEKSLDLVRLIDSHRWNPSESTTGETVNFVSTVARNGLIDYSRKQERKMKRFVDADKVKAQLYLVPAREAEPDADAKRFARALSDCASELPRRHRHAWIGRVFYDLGSREIAAQPELTTTPGNVDVILVRARRAIRDCMQSKGFTFTEAPAGCYAELWHRFLSQSLTASTMKNK